MRLLSVLSTVYSALSATVHLPLDVPADILQRPAWPAFAGFLHYHNRSYDTDAFRGKFETFADNMERIGVHSLRHDHTFALSKYADLSTSEFKDAVQAGCFKPSGKTSSCGEFVGPVNTNLPDSVDWRTKGAVTPVKNQAKCGSCWSFSASGALEGAWYKATGQLLSLSEQQLMDCSVGYGDNGCNGGMMDDAFEYAIDHGMCAESSEPYLGEDASCVPCAPVASFSHCTNVKSGDQLALKAAVAMQPVSVAIEADSLVFQFYGGGIIDSPRCGTNLDHGVLIVGYGTENGKKYWTLKNSWGPDWGENGYFRIARSESRHDPGVCGVAMQASYPSASTSLVGPA